MKKNSLNALLKQLRIRYWYEGVRLQMGVQSAYGLEKRFELQRISPDGEKQAPPKKWPRYKRGKVMPCLDMLVTVDKVAPGSLNELNSPLWKVLQVEGMTIRRIGRYIDLLEPRVRKAMLNWRRTETEGMQRHVRQSQGWSMVRTGSLDALAALVLMWEVYRHESREEDMRIIADMIYRCMLIAGVSFKYRGIATEFFDIFNAKIFSRTVWDDTQCKLDSEIFTSAIDLLDDVLSNVVDEGALVSFDDQARVKQKIMSGAKGADCRFGFRIPLVPAWEAGPPTKSQYKKGMFEMLQWLWGWNHLTRETIGRFPGDDLWKQLVIQVGVARL